MREAISAEEEGRVFFVKRKKTSIQANLQPRVGPLLVAWARRQAADSVIEEVQPVLVLKTGSQIDPRVRAQKAQSGILLAWEQQGMTGLEPVCASASSFSRCRHSPMPLSPRHIATAFALRRCCSSSCCQDFLGVRYQRSRKGVRFRSRNLSASRLIVASSARL